MIKKNWLALVFLAEVLLVGCATPAWNKYPIKVSPDYSCFYGGAEGGTRYYIWNCLEDKRVVIKQSGYGFWTTSAERYESSCGGKTEIENEQNLEAEQPQCNGKGRGKSHWETEPKSTQ